MNRADAHEGVHVADLLTGTVTFFFTDLEGSTRLWKAHPETMKRALALHDAILDTAVATHRGVVVKRTGDGVHAVFATPDDAVNAATDAQRALAQKQWGEPGPLRVRMGLHSGAAQLRDGDYYGSSTNRAARLMSVAHGRQIVSQATIRQYGQGRLEPRARGRAPLAPPTSSRGSRASRWKSTTSASPCIGHSTTTTSTSRCRSCSSSA